MSLPIYQRVAVTDAGDIIPGAEYTVVNENTGVAAPIYSDRTGATLLTAPYFADSAGTIQFFIAQGTTFRVAASGGVGTYTDRYVYGVAEAVLVQADGNVEILSGNVGIGTNSPDTMIELSASNSGGANNNTLRFTDTDATTQAGQSFGKIEFYSVDASNPGVNASINGFSEGTGGTGALSFGTGSGGNSERLRIDSAGNLLLGRTSTSLGDRGLLAYGGTSAGVLALVNAARPLYINKLTSDGNLIELSKDGTTVGSIGTVSGDLTIGTGDTGLRFSDSADALYPWNISTNVSRDNAVDLGGSTVRFQDLHLSGKANAGSITTADDNLGFNKISREGGPSLYLQQVDSSNDILQGKSGSGTPGGGTLRITVGWNGNVQNSNNSYGGLSDQKLKENIADASSQWDDLKAVRLRNYSMISDEETSANRLGVIAQELEAAGMGGLVDESDDLDENEERLGTTTKSVKYSILYMKAVGALQEAQTRIESLETLTQSLITRIEALEG